MDIKKISNFENLVQPEGAGALKSPVPGGMGQARAPKGPSFQDTLNALQGGMPQVPVGKMPAGNVQAPEALKFSNHAVERMQTRGISFNKADLERLNEAVGRAAAKGSKDTLVLMNDSALIVSVKNKTVVTVMDKTALKENVFTNIDSTIVM